MKRTQYACDQCRKSKRGCDAQPLEIPRTMDPLRDGKMIVGEKPPLAQSSPCSYCTKTPKNATMNWAWTQIQISYALAAAARGEPVSSTIFCFAITPSRAGLFRNRHQSRRPLISRQFTRCATIDFVPEQTEPVDSNFYGIQFKDLTAPEEPLSEPWEFLQRLDCPPELQFDAASMSQFPTVSPTEPAQSLIAVSPD
ncbi:hypothetical protein ACKAV7_008623 [Fusarium commune]